MPKNEEGEFELILGNRQLLSVFFIVVVLLGVFFTMGYIVGRNSSPAPAVDTARKTESRPIVVERASPSGSAADNSSGAASAPAETPAPATPLPAATTKAAEPPPPAAKSAPKAGAEARACIANAGSSVAGRHVPSAGGHRQTGSSSVGGCPGEKGISRTVRPGTGKIHFPRTGWSVPRRRGDFRGPRRADQGRL